MFIPTVPAAPPAAPAPAVQSPIEEKAPHKDGKPVSEAAAETAIKEATPVERWQKLLKDAKLSEDEALRIVDQVLQKGWWEREYLLWGGRLKVVLRSRDVQHRMRLRQALDAVLDKTDFTVSNVVCRCNTAGSLSSYQGRPLAFAPPDATRDKIEEAYQSREEFVSRLPDPVYEQITAALAHFDLWTMAAFAEGAAQGF
jgi:hypothetical protein